MVNTRTGETEPFGTLLRGHRLAASLSQEELAARARLSGAGIAAWERGRRAPRPATVGMLADALDLSGSERTAFINAATRERGDGGAPPWLPPHQTADLDLRTPCTYPFPAPVRLVGRDAELAFMQDVLVRGREAGQAVLIAGSAGAGKSTLLGELVRRAEAQGVVCLAGAAYEHTGVVPLGPLREALTAYLLQRPPQQARALVGGAAAELVAVAPELRYALDLPAGPTDASAEPTRLFAAVLALLRKVSETAPVLLIVEDLHAADVASLQLFGYLVRQLAYAAQQQSLVILGTYRPEAASTNPELASLVARFRRDRRSDMLHVQPLDRAATSELTADVLGGPASESLIDWLHETSAGNALFAQQLALALCEQGNLVQRDGIWYDPEGGSKTRDIPPVISDLIAQRVGRLSVESRATLDVCAVLGPNIEFDLLSIVREDRLEEAILEDLAEAVDLQILQAAPGGYAFAHALVREAIYSALPRPRRELLHGKIGRLIEEEAGARADEHAAALAHHFTRAAQSAATRAKALRYSLQAGRRAAAVWSFREALTHYTSASDLLATATDLPDRDATLLEALEGRGRAEREMGRWPECIATHQVVLTHTRDPVRRASARAMIAAVHIHMGDQARAFEETTAALEELAGATSDEAVGVRLYLQEHAARLLYFQGRFSDILQLGSEMLVAASASDRPRANMHAHLVTAWGHMGDGQVSAGLEHLYEGLRAAEREGNRVTIAVMHENLGFQYLLAGNFEAARQQLDCALQLYRDAAGELRAANTLNHRCRVLVAAGQLEQARERARRALDLEVGGHDRLAAEGYHILGLIDVIRAEWASATHHFTEALAVREHVKDGPGLVEAFVELGRVHQYAGDWRAARELFERAVDAADQVEPCPYHMQAHRALGRFLLLAGDEHAAARELQRAMVVAQAMPETFEYAPTLLALAELRLSQGDARSAAELAQQGLEHPETWFLDQLIEGQVIFANIQLVRGELSAASTAAAGALSAAEHLQAPRLMSLAALAGARTAAETREWPLALRGFEAAVDYAAQADAPYERATAMHAYARALLAARREPDLAASLQHEADRLLRPLVVPQPDRGRRRAAALVGAD